MTDKPQKTIQEKVEEWKQASQALADILADFPDDYDEEEEE